MDEEELMDAGFQEHRRSRPPVSVNGQRPHSREMPGYPREINRNALLGQLSFAPATQTTVVTTTTTTTTKFPPFLMRPPRQMQELDLKQYPLAGSPTPVSLRKIHFEIGGKQTIFSEAEDTSLALEQLEEERRTLRSANGTVRTVKTLQPWSETPGDELDLAPLHRRSQNRPASPESITEDEDRADLHRATFASSRRGPASRPAGRRERSLIPSVTRAQETQISNPITPESAPKPSSRLHRRSAQDASNDSRNTTTLLPSPNMDQQPTFPLPQAITPKPSQQTLTDLEEDSSLTVDHLVHGPNVCRGSSQDTAVPTPPIDERPPPALARPMSRRALSSIPARLHVAESPSGLDGSLPSPSLSPVTAAATMQQSGYFADIESNAEVASQHDMASAMAALERPSSNGARRSEVMDWQSHHVTRQLGRFASGSITEIPAMLDYFEAIPDELKSYVMHQLLRRCPKPTLQVVADTVNPALKCDFLTILPPELGLNVLKYLDLKSLCRAAQVSKKWRQMINSDEKAWKELFDADGFTLPEGELQRAITEGWGWQDPHGPGGYEENLSYMQNSKSETEANAQASSPSTPPFPNRFSGILRRSKRKAATMLSSRNKQVKHKISPSREDSIDVTFDWMSHMSTAEGPYNAANAAVLAVPHPDVGLPSLKGIHLYKSLYRRHHLIRKNWMFEDTKPQHLAFRAHDTHVVTCLQFDTDKILTGSDDNNINVYQTRTGVLKAILTGHEGGVWALQYEGNTLVSGSTDRSVRVWNIEEARETQVFRGHTSTVRCLQIVMPVKVGETGEGKPIMMPKQPLIITGSRDSTLRVWKLPKPEDPVFIQAENETDVDDCPYFVRTLTGHQHSVRAIAAHADTLVSGSYDCTVRVWKISTGETIHRLQGHTQKVYSVVLDHARNRCISGSMDNMVRIWDLHTGSLKYTLEGHTSLVGLLDLHCDKLVSAAADSTLRIWDPENGQCKATLSAHTGAITCFKHDGQKVISGSDRTLKLWNIKTGECIKDLLSDLSGVWQVKFDERRCVAAVQRDGLTYIEVLDYGAARDGVPEYNLGRRIVVDQDGLEANNDDGGYLDVEGGADA
ncbi:SCF ubiquitin ligase complex subunit cdc4 [Elasticomyces elasticus]|uniref:Probable E3 ubiquitin ligase complex SCF subunit sconB n=1 Tax=Exophiala sideris TaxID=1016849 RepID=A0ABR0JS28_9EURO|nr:SCF ubiquitin ligase complex subunit cdc4 [Elasticomyces elasticus]KAK5040373.1 SCF ubiquitin ligase complex subunit cdc4 [Exophiala sideris]KAK5043200.1 SCF ubiquitin ligase complex subunit cdc4 [Exophiala sideris]KAK5068751.1 SCF ubiquitin ligase complex subunit cdc4 [Exophiala sideris]KAK5186349.1 SCF ubiquitin ligase complex subunit cdc4 [Eurotiomycetes sp. CCFEE 6388]